LSAPATVALPEVGGRSPFRGVFPRQRRPQPEVLADPRTQRTTRPVPAVSHPSPPPMSPLLAAVMRPVLAARTRATSPQKVPLNRVQPPRLALHLRTLPHRGQDSCHQQLLPPNLEDPPATHRESLQPPATRATDEQFRTCPQCQKSRRRKSRCVSAEPRTPTSTSTRRSASTPKLLVRQLMTETV